MSACRSCGAAVEWVTTIAGKAMPLDLAPSATGNLVICGTGPAGPIVRAWHSSDTVIALAPRRVSHFATCKDAGKWRRR